MEKIMKEIYQGWNLEILVDSDDYEKMINETEYCLIIDLVKQQIFIARGMRYYANNHLFSTQLSTEHNDVDFTNIDIDQLKLITDEIIENECENSSDVRDTIEKLEPYFLYDLTAFSC